MSFFFFRRTCDGHCVDNVFVAALSDRESRDLRASERQQQHVDGQHLREEQPTDDGRQTEGFGR